MTKKLISIAVALLLMIPAVFSFVGCNNTITDFPDLSGCVANLTDATSVGISKVTKTSVVSKNFGLFASTTVKHDSEQLSTESDGKNYAMVGNDNGYEELAFTKITADTSAELIDGETRVIASFTGDKSVDIVSRNDNSITINVDTTCEYRVIDADGKVLVEWSKFEQGTHTFTVAHAKNAKVECRSLEAKISFNTLAGFEYSIYCKGKPVMEGLRDNDDKDTSKKNGHSEWGNLTEGESYEIRFKGHGKKDKFTQDKLGADIDKLYTVNGFTFISFVAKGKSKRPSESESAYWQDGVNVYDMVGYYTDNTRKSYVIDNATGYVYPLDNFHVKYITGGLLFSNENKSSDEVFVYDFKTTEDGKLNVFQLFSNNKNKSINSCVKDKYGHKYIVGPFEDGYDSNTDTHYFKEFTVVYATSEGTAFVVRDEMIGEPSFKISNSDGSLRDVGENDYFDVYETWWLTPLIKFTVKNGCVFRTATNGSSYGIDGAAAFYYDEERIDLVANRNDKDKSEFSWRQIEFGMFARNSTGKWENANPDIIDSRVISYAFFEKYNTVLAVKDGQLIRFNNVWEYCVDNKFNYDKNRPTCDFNVIYDGKLTLGFDLENERTILLEDGYNGQTKYEIAVDYVGNTVNFRLVEQSKYSRAPRVVTLQPINR